MPIFQLTPLQDNHAALEAAVVHAFDAVDRHSLQNGMGWLVRHNGTTIETSHKVGITGQAPGEKSPIGAVLVTLVGSYYGRGSSDMWEWLKTRFEGGL